MNRTAKPILVSILLLLGATIPALAGFKVGDKVQAWNIDWYDGTIAEIGSGSYAGYYLVKWDKFSTPQYVKESNIRSRPGAAAPARASATTAAWPRAGRYTCMGYAGGIGQFRWYLDLTRNGYTQHTPDLAGGQYNFDATSGRLFFLSGPYRANNWFGKFSVTREGKTHQIVLRDKAAEAQGPRVREYANINCTNSNG
jgi:hypothetical protein